MTGPDKHVSALKSMVEGLQAEQAKVFMDITALLRAYLDTMPPDQQLELRRRFVASFSLQMMFDEARKDQGCEYLRVDDAQKGSWAWCQDMAMRMCRACSALSEK